jgi:hypothetical protein
MGHENALSTLGDFTTTWRVLLLSSLASGIGVFSAFVALALLRLIGLFTNLFFFQRWDTTLVSPAGHTLGLFAEQLSPHRLSRDLPPVVHLSARPALGRVTRLHGAALGAREKP